MSAATTTATATLIPVPVRPTSHTAKIGAVPRRCGRHKDHTFRSLADPRQSQPAWASVVHGDGTSRKSNTTRIASNTLDAMAERDVTRNQASGTLAGSIVQAGSIDHVSMASLPSPVQPPVPRQLPLAIRQFIGRAEQLAALDALLPADRDSEVDNEVTAGTVVISALDGTAGVGKTALALHWAHHVQRHFPDGTLFANLRGYGPGEPATPADVLDGFLRALGIPPERIPIDMDAQAALYRSLLARRRVLIVLDNANHPDQVRPLLPAAAGCFVLVTSRVGLTGLVIGEAATRITLDLLGPQEAVDLVRGIVGPERADTEADAVTRLTQVCGRLPLALRIAASQVTARAHWAIADLLAEMADDQKRLDALSSSLDNTTAVRAVFDWSYRRLPSGQARLFRRLGLHPGPEISIHAAAALADLPITHAHRMIEEIADAHMIEPVAHDRYRFHDLLRAYAAERANHDDNPDERDQARRRLLNWYAYATVEADHLLLPGYWRFPFDSVQPVGPPLTLADRAHALGWLDSEHTNLVAAARSAILHDLPDLTMQFIETLGRFLGYRAHRHDLLECIALGLTAAQRGGNRAAEAWFLNTQGEALASISQWDEALDCARRGLNIARDMQDRHLEATALNDIGLCFLGRERYAEALDYLEAALPISGEYGDIRQTAYIEGNLSQTHTGMGNYHLARDHAERGLVLRRQAGDRYGESLALHHLARAWQGMGFLPEAIARCEEAINGGHEYSRYPPDIASFMDTLGALLWHNGDHERAETCWAEALQILDEFGDRRAASLRVRIKALRTMAADENALEG